MELHQWSSMLIMNISFAVYISLIDLLIKTPNDVFRVLADPEKKDKILGDTADARMENIQEISEKAFPLFQLFKTGAILFLINYLFFDTFNQALVRRDIVMPNQYIDPTERHSLESYYPKWKAQMDSSLPVVLIAGQGGGSRAGAWMAMNLERLFPLDSLHLLRNVFAISTVSGSSSGANMMLHKWQAAKKGSFPKSEQQKNLDFVKALYGYNYLSAAMWGLLWSDGIRAWFPTKSGFVRDRNYYRQLDESKAFAECYPDSSREQLEAYFHEDYLQRWYRDSAMFLPLFFVNTANTQAGKRCIVSPVTLADSIFGTAIDLYQEIKRDSDTPIWSFPGVTAVNLSQAFPFVCNYNYIEGVGNMIDGGLYENSGANTVYEIYEFLRKKDSRLKFRILLIQNSDNDNRNTNPVNSILKNTLSSALSSPFSGHSHYWEQWLLQKARENQDEVVQVYLKNNEGWQDIPLGILLSEEKIEWMYEVMEER
ncbi:MAG TPA: hypothetical protein VFX48_04790 [Saprospiraceae bacterium]|nr:hypothetical protein [Saprospiraceae bacterium]